MSRLRLLFVAAAAVAGLGALLPAATAHTESVYVGEIGLDGTLFWEGTSAGANPVHALPFAPSNAAVDRCTIPEHQCQIFELDVADAGAWSLRVGFDTPERDDNFEVAVESPSGVRTRLVNPNAYSVEASIPDPEPGLWHIFLAPYSAEEAPIRFRAKLERERPVAQADADGYLLPNLIVTRTWEFGFAAPINPLNGPFLAPDDANPPLAAGPVAPVSCSPDETANDGATRCLRYSFGLGNSGAGPFDVRWTANETSMGHGVFQCLARSDNTVEAHDAGTGSYHATHGHWHYDDVVWHQLYSVGADRLLVPAGKGKKIGYSPADQGIVQWDQFTQDRAGTSASAGNCVAGSNRRLGLSRGWGDAYRYQRAGNYVDFGINGDGEYVVHTIADPMGHLRETTTVDNTFYTHIRVTGNAVEVLESGYGQSPWDPNKVVVKDWWVE
jgi:hypothetical protein